MQLSLTFEAGIAAVHRSLREFIAQRIYQRGITQVAGRLDMGPSHLTEKLAGCSTDGKKRGFTIDELEAYIEKYDDPSPIYYLIDKYLRDPKVAQAEALARIATFADQLPGLLAAAGFGKGRK